MSSIYPAYVNSDFTFDGGYGGYLIDASDNDVTGTLPAASDNDGTPFYLKRLDTSANIVTIAVSGSDTIDNQTSLTLNSDDKSLIFAFNGAWVSALGKGNPPTLEAISLSSAAVAKGNPKPKEKHEKKDEGKKA